MMEAGGTSTRLFSQQADLVKQTSAQLGTSLAGNRALVEIKLRNGEMASKIAQMERDYLKTHRYLDSGFDQQLSEETTKHPLYNEKELAHPEILGAPTIPSDIRVGKNDAAGMAKLQSWGRQMGIKPGDAIRGPDGNVYHMP